jgi:hypothetical protein
MCAGDEHCAGALSEAVEACRTQRRCVASPLSVLAVELKRCLDGPLRKAALRLLLK